MRLDLGEGGSKLETVVGMSLRPRDGILVIGDGHTPLR